MTQKDYCVSCKSVGGSGAKADSPSASAWDLIGRSFLSAMGGASLLLMEVEGNSRGTGMGGVITLLPCLLTLSHGSYLCLLSQLVFLAAALPLPTYAKALRPSPTHCSLIHGSS